MMDMTLQDSRTMLTTVSIRVFFRGDLIQIKVSFSEVSIILGIDCGKPKERKTHEYVLLSV